MQDVKAVADYVQAIQDAYHMFLVCRCCMLPIVQIHISDTYVVIYIDSLCKTFLVQMISFVNFPWMSKKRDKNK